MAMILCSACGRASIDVDQMCQFCGKFLKLSIWTRKLRRREALGFILIFTGAVFLSHMKGIGIALLILGFIVAGSGVHKRREYIKRSKVSTN